MTAGPLLAGVLVAWIGFAWTYTIDVVSFAFWALLKLPPMPPGNMPVRPGCVPWWRVSASSAPGPTSA